MVLHLLQERGMSVDEVWTMLYQQSGLQGVSGISNSMQVLTESDEPAAQEAVDLFCHRAVCEIGALSAGMGGLNGIVFTAGIGENSRIVRERIVSQLEWLGASLDAAANERVGLDPDKAGGIISTPESQTTVAVIPTDEQLVIARATAALT
jgi:acetate kinase